MANKLKVARKLFQDLKLDNWRESKDTLTPGAQAAVLVVEREDGSKGVFRCLGNEDPKAIARFHRELQILTDPEFQHPSIIKLLDYTKDEKPWYISKLGQSFEEYWKEQLDFLAEEPDELVHLAVKHLVQILEGLTLLHGKKIVHRDIKPANMVILDSSDELKQAALIDFGIAYVAIGDNARLTDVGETVRNKGFGPDPTMLYRTEEVTPWLDIFMLAQVLSWMVGEDTVKKWTRPLDWRFVHYDPRISADLKVAIVAVTAVCSEKSNGPEDAGQFFQQLKALFPTVFTSASTAFSLPPADLLSIREAISHSKAMDMIKIAEDRRVASSAFPLIEKDYPILREGFEEIYREFKKENLSVEKSSDRPIQNLLNQAQSMSSNRGDVLYELVFRGVENESFQIRVSGLFYPPRLRKSRTDVQLPESSNPFTLWLQKYANLRFHREGRKFPHCTKILTWEKNGQLMLRDERMKELFPTKMSEVIREMKSWAEDREAWEIIHQSNF